MWKVPVVLTLLVLGIFFLTLLPAFHLGFRQCCTDSCLLPIAERGAPQDSVWQPLKMFFFQQLVSGEPAFKQRLPSQVVAVYAGVGLKPSTPVTQHGGSLRAPAAVAAPDPHAQAGTCPQSTRPFWAEQDNSEKWEGTET